MADYSAEGGLLQKIIEEIERLRAHLVGCASCTTCESTAGYHALRAVVERHKPEQHYTLGQDNRRAPSRLYCRTCRATSPCAELLTIARELGIEDGDGS